MTECVSVRSVTPCTDYSLLLTFKNGEKRKYNARPLLDYKINEPLKELGFFMQAKVKYGTVVWNEDIDVDPEHLYECSVPLKQ